MCMIKNLEIYLFNYLFIVKIFENSSFFMNYSLFKIRLFNFKNFHLCALGRSKNFIMINNHSEIAHAFSQGHRSCCFRYINHKPKTIDRVLSCSIAFQRAYLHIKNIILRAANFNPKRSIYGFCF
jgi:hypothetical protein